MSIKTNELSVATSMAQTDKFVVDTSTGTQSYAYSALEDAMRNIIFCGGVPYGKELTDDWATLADKIAEGDFSGIKIGDYKTITLTTGETVILEAAGIDQYMKHTDQDIRFHHVDFISRDCLNTLYQMNPEPATNNGNASTPIPWLASSLYDKLNNAETGVITTLPTDLQNVIITKRMLMEHRYTEGAALSAPTTWGWVDCGKLWLPTEVEMWGRKHWNTSGYSDGNSIQYPLFIGNSRHMVKGKGNGGTRQWWWTCTSMTGSTTHWCGVTSTGTATHYWSTNSLGVPLCVRVGRQ